MAFLVSAFSLAIPTGGQAVDASLVRIGTLQIPRGASSSSFSLMGIDVPNRRLYIDYNGGTADFLAEYDLTHTIPTLARAIPFDSSRLNTSAYAFAFDSLNHRAFSIVNKPPLAIPDIQVFDLKTLSFVGQPWSIQTKLPGFDPMGLAYSDRDHRLYVAGLFTGGLGAGVGTYTLGLPAVPGGIAAFDTNGNLEWWKPLPQCQYLGGHFDWAAAIFASVRLPALYVFCVRPSNVGVETEYPGESGLLRLWITPNGTQSDANSYRVEFFPTAGHYVSGGGMSVFSAFDPVAERFFVVNQSSTTPGMWAFDGSLSAWVGFTATDSEQNYGLGLDTSTGHVFIKAGDTGATGNTTSIEHIIVAAGRDTPTPQGVKFPFDVNNSQVLWMVDSPTHRVILPMENGDMAVLLDRTPVTSPRVVDYDSLTADIPEGSDTASTFAGDASGFGARALLVGGYGGLLDPINANTGGATPSTVGGFSPGDRSVTAANVPLIDLRDTGAAASAQSVAPDSLTQNDYSTEQQNVKTNGNSVKPGTGTEIARRMDWQWPAATCLDAEGKKDEQPQSGPGGNSLVTCDLANAFDSATTSYNGFDLQGVTVGSASFETTSQRDPKKGLVTTATAVARDVRILVDTGGSLFIQRVEATATTTAHGRTGTAKASWASLIEGVVLRDANGAVLFSCDQCDPRSLSDQVNSSVLSTKLRILLPNALVQTTPHGAFASVGKNDTDYWSGLTLNDDNSRAVPAMQIEVYNDYGQKSRLVVQLASIQASSIYGIHRIPQFQPGSGGGIVPPEVLPSVVHQNPGVYLNGGGNVGSVGGDLSTYRKLVRGLGLLVRSPKDAVLFALVCLLFVGSAAVARRRQLLASSLEEIVK